jgi:hypothetical protein
MAAPVSTVRATSVRGVSCCPELRRVRAFHCTSHCRADELAGFLPCRTLAIQRFERSTGTATYLSDCADCPRGVGAVDQPDRFRRDVPAGRSRTARGGLRRTRRRDRRGGPRRSAQVRVGGASIYGLPGDGGRSPSYSCAWRGSPLQQSQAKHWPPKATLTEKAARPPFSTSGRAGLYARARQSRFTTVTLANVPDPFGSFEYSIRTD